MWAFPCRARLVSWLGRPPANQVSPPNQPTLFGSSVGLLACPPRHNQPSFVDCMPCWVGCLPTKCPAPLPCQPSPLCPTLVWLLGCLVGCLARLFASPPTLGKAPNPHATYLVACLGCPPSPPMNQAPSRLLTILVCLLGRFDPLPPPNEVC